MSEEMVVRQCAPTLAGIKTGSLFPCPCTDRDALLDEVRQLNRRLSPKGLCLLPLRFTEGSALLYLYRPATLRRDLSELFSLEAEPSISLFMVPPENLRNDLGVPTLRLRLARFLFLCLDHRPPLIAQNPLQLVGQLFRPLEFALPNYHNLPAQRS